MTGATHLVAAAAIYKHGRFKKPTMLFLAFLSHFLLDAMPHYELSMTWNYLLAAAASVFLLITAKAQRDYKIFVAGILGGLPDLNWLLHISPLLSSIHHLFHFKKLFPVPFFIFFFETALAFYSIHLLQKKDKSLPAIE